MLLPFLTVYKQIAERVLFDTPAITTSTSSSTRLVHHTTPLTPLFIPTTIKTMLLIDIASNLSRPLSGKLLGAPHSGAASIRCLSATPYNMPPIRPMFKPTSTSDTRTVFTNAPGQSLMTLAPRHVVKSPSPHVLIRQIAHTAMPLVGYNTAHSASPPAPGADFNVLMIGAGVSAN
jgi:hypothetical protein